MKQTIKLTESQLKQVVTETIKKVLSENELNEIFGFSQKEKDLKVLKQKILKAINEINNYNFNRLFYQSSNDGARDIQGVLIRKRQALEEMPTYFELMPELLDNNNRLYNGRIAVMIKTNSGELIDGVIPAFFNAIYDERRIISNEIGREMAKRLLAEKYPNIIQANGYKYTIKGEEI